jgi:small GTP-binding protein
MSRSDLARPPLADVHFNRARASLRQLLNRYRQERSRSSLELQAALKPKLDQLAGALDKLNGYLVRVAVFGLVSRGKSAVLNALMDKKVLQTGPLHGVTQWPRSVFWSLETAMGTAAVELIDTPGLDEVDGQARATMARDIAAQADLILFVIAGDITRTEYDALRDLLAARKPLIVVFNKTDLYPNRDRTLIYRQIQERLYGGDRPDRMDPSLTLDDIVLVAAEPAPVAVQVEWPDGRITQDWEAPPPTIAPLTQRLLAILNREGKSLLALNAMRQAELTEAAIAQTLVQQRDEEAERLIWKFAQWKGIAVALNPIAVLDVVGGTLTDLAMIRALARLYGLPMTRYEASKLLNSILWSGGRLVLGEVISNALLGIGKSGAAIAGALDGGSSLAAYGTAAAAQAAIAGYGSYQVGRAAQRYLEQGCTWGPLGASTVLQEILSQVDADTVIARLKTNLHG